MSSYPDYHRRDEEDAAAVEQPASSPSTVSLIVETIVCILVLLSAVFLPDVVISHHQREIPLQETEAGDELLDLRLANERVDSAVPTLLLNILAFVIPLLVELALGFFVREQSLGQELSAVVCINCLAQGLQTWGTEFLKLYVGYWRPNFYDRCDFDVESRVCQDQEQEAEARKSFSSGHAATSFCGLMLLTLYLNYKWGMAAWKRRLSPQAPSPYNKDFSASQKSGPWTLASVRLLSVLFLLPVALATYIAATRVRENNHHPADVVGGALLGGSIAVFIFGLWFP